MANKSVASQAKKIAGELAEKMGLYFVDAELTVENGAAFLRIYVDETNGGIGLDRLEGYHRELNKLVEDLEYDYLEVSSPGIGRPLKTERDFARMMGRRIELRLYQPADGKKSYIGTLTGFENGEICLETAEGGMRFLQKSVAKAAPVEEEQHATNEEEI